MGPLVNRRAVDDMMDGIRRISEQGGEILFGGERMMGCFVQPTLVRATAGHADSEGGDLRADPVPGGVR